MNSESPTIVIMDSLTIPVGLDYIEAVDLKSTHVRRPLLKTSVFCTSSCKNSS